MSVDKLFPIVQIIINVANFITNSSGYTVTGWYKNGTKNDIIFLIQTLQSIAKIIIKATNTTNSIPAI